jgi:molybdenum cofactor cytidylyltransferase
MESRTDLPVGSGRGKISVAIIMLAAGRSSRMSPAAGHKLLATFDGVPLARRMALRAIASTADDVQVITGFRRKEIEACLLDLDMKLAFNPDYATGMASSLVTGLKIAQVMNHDGALILLADMPAVTTSILNSLIEAFRRAEGRSVVRAVHAGTQGNPVILPRTIFEQAFSLRGDRGARKLIESSGLDILDVEIGEAAVVDVDTRQDLKRQGGVPASTDDVSL